MPFGTRPCVRSSNECELVFGLAICSKLKADLHATICRSDLAQISFGESEYAIYSRP